MRLVFPLIAALCVGCGQDDDAVPSGADSPPSDAGLEADVEIGHDADSATVDQDVPDQAPDTVEGGEEPDAQADGPVESGPGPWQPYAVVSLNLHCLKLDGTSFATQAERFGAIAEAAAARGVAAMAVQEACERPGESAIEMLRSALESATGQAWTKAWVETHVAWAGTSDEATEGVGLLARGQLTSPVPYDYHVQGPLERLALQATLPADLGSLRLVTMHLDHDQDAVRAAQARETAALAVALADPSLDVILAGDFNASEQEPAHRAVTAFGFDDLTDSLDAGRIDHVMAHRGASVELLEAAPIFDGDSTPIVSDHHGVLVRIGPSVAQAAPRTRIRATAQTSAGEYLAVRGDTAPLTWNAGYPARQLSSDTWELLLTEIPAAVPFEFKLLRNDQDWEQGPNHAGTGESTTQASPVF